MEEEEGGWGLVSLRKTGLLERILTIDVSLAGNVTCMRGFEAVAISTHDTGTSACDRSQAYCYTLLPKRAVVHETNPSNIAKERSQHPASQRKNLNPKSVKPLKAQPATSPLAAALFVCWAGGGYH